MLSMFPYYFTVISFSQWQDPGLEGLLEKLFLYFCVGHILQYYNTKSLSNAYEGLENLVKRWNEGEISHKIKIDEWSRASCNSPSSKDLKTLNWTDIEMMPIVVFYTT